MTRTIQRWRNLTGLVLGVLAFAAAPLSAQQQFQGVCANVKIVIEQELAFERIGFEATLEITNNLGGDPITDFSAQLTFNDPNDLVSGVPRDVSDRFFVQRPRLTDVNATDDMGATALHWAAAGGHLGVVKLLGESSIGAGTRRVEALVGADAYRFLAREALLVSQLAEQLKAPREELPDRVEALVARLREAVKREDALRYDEPPDWLIPVRHSLGAALMNLGRYREAEQVYREDLARIADNGWSLYGLGRALQHLGRDREAEPVLLKFKEVWAHADFELTTSCLCQPARN